MDSIFIHVLMLTEAQLMGLCLLATLAGAGLAALLPAGTSILRRVSYLWIVALIGAGLSATQLVFLFTAAAAHFGVLWLAICFGIGAFAVSGGLILRASEARARDIGRSRHMAWLGLIPIANLWLMFAQRRADHPDGKLRLDLKWKTLDPILVVLAIGLILLTRAYERSSADLVAYDYGDNERLRQLVANARTVEESFAMEAYLMRSELPVRFDETVVLRGVDADGTTLRFTFEVEDDHLEFPLNFEAMLAEEDCSFDTFGAQIARGGTVVNRYRTSDGSAVKDFAITQVDCTV